jgi:3-hydroxy acid dehydrogenase/malonic semialdehyde reductase
MLAGSSGGVVGLPSALITGASSGFGLALARRWVWGGGAVVGLARRADRLAEVARELGPAFRPLVGDVRDAALVARLPELAGPVEVVVNNAGLALGLGKVPMAELADWDTMIATNCTALAHVTRAMAPGLVARGRGHVVNVGSIASTHAYPGGNVYGATKAFVRQFSANLRADLHGSGVRVTLVEPAAARTEFSDVRFKGDAGRAGAVYQGYEPLSADDVADAVFWAATRPAHVDVAVIELWPTAQSPGGTVVHRVAP